MFDLLLYLSASFATFQSLKLPGQYLNLFLIIVTKWHFLQYALYVHFQIIFSSKLLVTMIAFKGKNFAVLGFFMHAEIDLLGKAR